MAVFEPRTHPLSASLGQALNRDDGEEIGDLMEKADACMYEAKRDYKASHPHLR